MIQLQFRITDMIMADVPALGAVLAAVTLAPLDTPAAGPMPGSGMAVAEVLPRPFRVAGIPVERAGQYRINDIVTITVSLPTTTATGTTP